MKQNFRAPVRNISTVQQRQWEHGLYRERRWPLRHRWVCRNRQTKGETGTGRPKPQWAKRENTSVSTSIDPVQTLDMCLYSCSYSAPLCCVVFNCSCGQALFYSVLFCFLTRRADAAKSSRRNCKLWDSSQHWKVSNRYTFSIFTLYVILLVQTSPWPGYWHIARGGCVCVGFVNSLECRTCVVIGNGFAIKNSSLGNIINKYDVVIR